MKKKKEKTKQMSQLSLLKEEGRNDWNGKWADAEQKDLKRDGELKLKIRKVEKSQCKKVTKKSVRGEIYKEAKYMNKSKGSKQRNNKEIKEGETEQKERETMIDAMGEGIKTIK